MFSVSTNVSKASVQFHGRRLSRCQKRLSACACMPSGAEQAQGRQRQGVRQPLELPGGGVLLDSSAVKLDVVYGNNFVIQRPKRGGPGLVVASPYNLLHAPTPEQVVDLVLRPRPVCTAAYLPASSFDIDVTDYDVLADSHAKSTGTWFPPTKETGLILMSTNAEEQVTPAHPRRTGKFRFTCNRCGARTEKPINPHAWQNGTVFARCDGCKIVHKVIDNLNLIHEWKGLVFPSAVYKKPFKIPKGLPQNPGQDL